MTWFKVDDSFVGHPKRAQCSLSALGLWVVAGSWSAQQLTNGLVPRHMLTLLGGRAKDAAELVRVGLWEAADEGWTFHDWPDYQPSREQVESERHAARERQRRAREAAKSRRDIPRDSRGSNGASHGPPDPTRPVPVVLSELPGARAPRRRPSTSISDDWTPTETHADFCREHRLDLEHQADQFRRHAAAKDLRYANWNAAFSTWLGKAREWSRPATAPVDEKPRRTFWDNNVTGMGQR